MATLDPGDALRAILASYRGSAQDPLQKRLDDARISVPEGAICLNLYEICTGLNSPAIQMFGTDLRRMVCYILPERQVRDGESTTDLRLELALVLPKTMANAVAFAVTKYVAGNVKGETRDRGRDVMRGVELSTFSATLVFPVGGGEKHDPPRLAVDVEAATPHEQHVFRWLLNVRPGFHGDWHVTRGGSLKERPVERRTLAEALSSDGNGLGVGAAMISAAAHTPVDTLRLHIRWMDSGTQRAVAVFMKPSASTSNRQQLEVSFLPMTAEQTIDGKLLGDARYAVQGTHIVATGMVNQVPNEVRQFVAGAMKMVAAVVPGKIPEQKRQHMLCVQELDGLDRYVYVAGHRGRPDWAFFIRNQVRHTMLSGAALARKQIALGVRRGVSSVGSGLLSAGKSVVMSPLAVARGVASIPNAAAAARRAAVDEATHQARTLQAGLRNKARRWGLGST